MKAKYIYWIFFIALSVAVHWVHPVSTDEGIVLTGAWQVAQGLAPYKDFFAIETPGVYYLFGSAFTVFGSTYIVAKILALFLFLFSSAALYKISKMIFKNDFFAFLTPVIWLLLTKNYVLINHNTISIMFFFWAVYFVLRRLPKDYYFAGLFGALSFLFLQTKGAVFIAFILVACIFYIRATKNQIAQTAISFVIPTLFLLLLPFKEVYSQIFLFPLKNYLPFNQLPLTYFFASLFAHGVVAILLYIKKVRTNIWIIFWASLLLSLSAYTRPDFHHVILNSVLLWVLVFYLIQNVLYASNTYFYFGISVMVAALLAVSYVRQISFQTFSEFITLQNPHLNEIISVVEKNSSKDSMIFAGPFIPGYYFETQRSVPSAYSYFIPQYFPDTFLTQLASDLQKNSPDVALIFYGNVSQYKYSKENAVEQYIQRNYKILGKYFGVEILKRFPLGEQEQSS